MSATPPPVPADADRRAQTAQARRDPPPRPRAAPHRPDPALATRGTAAHPHRGRDRRPRRLQRRHPPQGRRVPRRQDPRRVRPVRLLDPEGDVRLPRQPGMDSGARRTWPWSDRPARGSRTCSSHSARRRSRPGTGSATSPPPTSSKPSTAAWPTTPSAASSTSPAPRPDHHRRDRLRPARRHRRPTAVPARRRRLRTPLASPSLATGPSTMGTVPARAHHRRQHPRPAPAPRPRRRHQRRLLPHARSPNRQPTGAAINTS